MSIPDSIATTTARDVVLQQVFKALRATVADLQDSGQIETADALELTEQVSKALLSVPASAGETEVLKSLPYGALTTDAALLTQGGALTGLDAEPEAISEYGKRRIAKALYDDTVAGLSPVSKALGYTPPADMEEFRTDVADCFMQEFGVNTDDGLECAEHFFNLLAGR